jgi:predicted MPP superfamily phosphohydrolase
LRVLHISDLHVDSSFQQKQVIAALLKDVALQNQQEQITCVVFSGDAAAKGGTEAATADLLVSRFFDPLRQVIGLTVPIIVCPGNHDVNLKRRQEVFAPIFTGVDRPEKASKLASQAAESQEASAIWGHLDGFRAFAKKIDDQAFCAHPLYYTKVIDVGHTRVGFAAINTAWMTNGGGAADYGKLYVGEYVLAKALEELKHTDLKFVVGHHPLEWLAPEERGVVLRQITLNFDGYFCGHKHDNTAESLRSNVGHVLTSNTGCVYENREYFNGYSLVDFDLDSTKRTIHAREYYYQRDAFDSALRFGENGVFAFYVERSLQEARVLIPSAAISAINEKANSQLLSHETSDVAPKSMGALFVEPPLSTMSEKEVLAKSKNGEAPGNAYTSLSALASETQAVLFLGKREAGKSLLLHQIVVNQVQQFKATARIGVVVDLHALKKNTEASILELAVEFCGSELRRAEIKQLLSEGEIVVCFDNFRPNDPVQLKTVRDFVSHHSKARYIFAAQEELTNTVGQSKSPDLGVPALTIYVHSFRAKQTKELVRRWFGIEDVYIEQRIQTVNQLLDRLRVPRTPFLVSVLLWVIEQRPNASVINRAAAVEVLIDGLLEKLSETKFRKSFDSTIQQHCLAEIAVALNVKDADWMGRLDFDAFLVEYFKKRGLNVSIEGFASDLVDKGILYLTDDRAGFKFDCFRAYFLSKKFVDQPELWQLALTPAMVQKYSMELDLFTGIHRDRADVLERAKKLCEEAYNGLGIAIPRDAIEKFADRGKQNGKTLFDIIEESLVDETPGRLVDEHELPDVVSVDHEEARKRRKLPDWGQVGRFVDSLRVFSMILRNSELVDDFELKRLSLEVALNHWANTANAVILGTIEEAQRLELQYSTGEQKRISDNVEELSYIARALVPMMVVSLMTESLSTPKLELFVLEQIRKTDVLTRILAVSLLLDGEHPKRFEEVRSLIKEHLGNGLVVEIIFFRLLGIFMDSTRSSSSTEAREILGDVFVKMKGWSALEASSGKARFLEKIDKLAKPTRRVDLLPRR